MLPSWQVLKHTIVLSDVLKSFVRVKGLPPRSSILYRIISQAILWLENPETLAIETHILGLERWLRG